MNQQKIHRASAPGSLMLLGEHAVLHGRHALVSAINQRITVVLRPLPDSLIQIRSCAGFYERPVHQLDDHPRLRFVLDSVRSHRLEQGCALEIESDISGAIGFSSSAAVTVAAHAVLAQYKTGEQPDRQTLFQNSLATIRRVQGVASGADAAAAVFGGLIAYRAEPLDIQPVPLCVHLTAVYSGSKMKTADVIRFVEQQREADPERFETLFDQMDQCTAQAVRDPTRLGEMLERNQRLMEQVGLCNAPLEEIIRCFRTAGVPAKISGSGLGDCAVGLGPFPAPERFPTFSLETDPHGIQYG